MRPFSPPCSSSSTASEHSQTTVSALQVSAATTAYVTLATGFSISGTLLVMEMLTPGLLRLYDRLDRERRLSTLWRGSRASRVPREYVSRRASRASRRASRYSRGRRGSRPSRVILVEPATPTAPSTPPSAASAMTPLPALDFFH